MNPLEGKVALITGAKGGLGSFVTEEFLAAGAKVVGGIADDSGDRFRASGICGDARGIIKRGRCAEARGRCDCEVRAH